MYDHSLNKDLALERIGAPDQAKSILVSATVPASLIASTKALFAMREQCYQSEESYRELSNEFEEFSAQNADDDYKFQETFMPPLRSYVQQFGVNNNYYPPYLQKVWIEARHLFSELLLNGYEADDNVEVVAYGTNKGGLLLTVVDGGKGPQDSTQERWRQFAHELRQDILTMPLQQAHDQVLPKCRRQIGYAPSVIKKSEHGNATIAKGFRGNGIVNMINAFNFRFGYDTNANCHALMLHSLDLACDAFEIAHKDKHNDKQYCYNHYAPLREEIRNNATIDDAFSDL
jgi:hypothetical protein